MGSIIAKNKAKKVLREYILLKRMEAFILSKVEPKEKSRIKRGELSKMVFKEFSMNCSKTNYNRLKHLLQTVMEIRAVRIDGHNLYDKLGWRDEQ